MARPNLTQDAFAAIAEPKRRVLIEQLAGTEMSVGELAAATQWRQPTVSKHLAVLREAGIVTDRAEGRCRIYRIMPQRLRPIQEWLHQFEAYWGGTLDQLDTYLETLDAKGAPDDTD